MSRSSRSPAAVLAALGTAVGVLAASVLVALPAEASRRVSESYTVPSDGTLRLSGHGYGHGHGMSQYGAQGAAKQGLTARQILAFYYPGTKLADTDGPVRVLITADTDDDVRVLAADGLRVREVSSGATYALPEAKGRSVWRLRTVSGKTVLDYYDGRWHAYLPDGKALSGAAEFFRSGTLTLKVAGTDRVYRGAMRLDAANTVNVLSLDDYVKGVVPREMPASWQPAAVQAQAVAARTYASWERAAHPTRSYQTCDTTSCQVYGGVGAEDSRSNAAVDATSGQILTYQGKPAFTQFGSSSGGWTAAGSMPYLVAKADKYDDYSGNPVHSWSTTVKAATIARAWPAVGTLRRVLVTQRDGNGDWSGRVESLTLQGSKSDVVVTGYSFRSALGLRTNWFRFGSGSAPAPAPSPTPSPTASPKPTPAPDPAPTSTSPITARWKAIGGRSSVVRRPVSKEYAAAGGRARRYQRGRIFFKADIGAHELYGKVVRPYMRRGGPRSKLGFPTAAPRTFSRGVSARFEHGVLKVYRSGKVRVRYFG